MQLEQLLAAFEEKPSLAQLIGRPKRNFPFARNISLLNTIHRRIQGPVSGGHYEDG